jgi:hypothetical protein
MNRRYPEGRPSILPPRQAGRQAQAQKTTTGSLSAVFPPAWSSRLLFLKELARSGPLARGCTLRHRRLLVNNPAADYSRPVTAGPRMAFDESSPRGDAPSSWGRARVACPGRGGVATMAAGGRVDPPFPSPGNDRAAAPGRFGGPRSCSAAPADGADRLPRPFLSEPWQAGLGDGQRRSALILFLGEPWERRRPAGLLRSGGLSACEARSP